MKDKSFNSICFVFQTLVTEKYKLLFLSATIISKNLNRANLLITNWEL